MCGIGYVGARDATAVVLEGLKRLEYRGYDSAGLAVLNGVAMEVRRASGKIERLVRHVADHPLTGAVGLGHTRWATHGRPSEANAHPHRDCAGGVAVVHNGIVENYLPLKRRLQGQGHRFCSETDTEVIAHLIESRLPGGDLVTAVRSTLAELQGASAVAVVSAADPELIVAARRGAGGVIVGLGEGETFLASDIAALLPYTRSVLVLEEGELVELTRGGARLSSLDGRPLRRDPRWVGWDAAMAEKDGYRHFMLKEIHEQPGAVAATLGAHADLAAMRLGLEEARLDLARDVRRVVLVACGTSYHAAMVGRFMIERLAGLPVEVDIASEFRYRDLVLSDTLVVALSQSGETADTLGAAKRAREAGAPLVAITNVVGSALAREATGVVYTHAGPEIGVASSKTFVATAAACHLLALALGRMRGHLSTDDVGRGLRELAEVPALMAKALELEPDVAGLARELRRSGRFLFLGRGVHHPIALEGALKLKELAYVAAEGYAAGEMKHGPIALIDEHMAVIALMPRDGSRERMLGNVMEVKARGGFVVMVGDGDGPVGEIADRSIAVPHATALLTPLVSVIPLQLLAYHIATLRGHDVDQPRNLAKSVTVE